jgi:hypothetical protein
MECVNLSVIPQFGGTCWFNAILIVALYSQNVRKILIKESKKWSKSNSFLMVLKAVLIKYYNQPEKVQDFFSKIKPESILFKMIKTYNDVELLNFFKAAIKDGSGLGFDSDFIIRFFKYIGIKTLDIVITKEKGWIYNKTNYYLNTDKEFTFIYDKLNKNKFTLLKDELKYYKNPELAKEKKLTVIEETSRILEDIPDILIIKHEDLITFQKDNYNFLDYYMKEFNSSTYNFNSRGLDTYDDIIHLNGHIYKLDAVTLNNYNGDIGLGHAIAGITCNENRYVYNGWNSGTMEPALKSGLKTVNPCSLMKYDWDIKKDEDFCLNPETCKLDFVTQKKDLCFSFGKGKRILIYTRLIDDESNDTYLSTSDFKLSGLSTVIKDIYDIKNLTDDEIINNLKRDFNINLPPIVKDNRAALERYYYNVLFKKAGKRQLKKN